MSMQEPDGDDRRDYGAEGGDREEGRVTNVNDDGYGVVENEDGSVTISYEEDDARGDADPDHFANLAEAMSKHERMELGLELCELVERDAESWNERDRLYADGIKQSGVSAPAPGGAQFVGASKATHPMIIEAQIDFSARAMKELVPPDGPCRQKVMGEQTRRKLDRARRKADYMNWQVMHQVVGFRPAMKQTMMQLADAGSQFTLWGWDDDHGRPTFEPILSSDIIIPASATCWHTAHRKTHRKRLTEYEFRRSVDGGQYVDPGTAPPASPERTDVDKAKDRAIGRDEDAYNQDGVRTVYAIYVMRDHETEGEVRPYIISVDKYAREVVGVHRNWDPDDVECKQIDWITDWTFIDWMGPYGIGFPHAIGGLSAAATGALRALLDSGLIQSIPAALKLKGASRGGQSVVADPTTIMEIDGGPGADDIRKIAMPFPFNAPSPTLFQLLGFLVDAGKGVVRTVLEETADSNVNVPVGTTLARIEQGMAVFSDIHAGLHYSMARCLRTLHVINRMFMDDRVTVRELGELIVTRKDFQGPMDVIPVSDPNIFSDAQRTAQAQAIAQRSDSHAGLYDARKVEEFLLDRLKMPFAKDLLAKPPEPEFLNAVNENVAAVAARPIIAFPEQDHLAHIQVHADFLKSKMLGSMPTMAPKYIPVILEHLNQHISFFYVTTIHAYASEAAGRDISEMIPKRDEAEATRAYDQMLAAASVRAMPEIERALSKVMPVIQQAMQLMGQLQQNQNQDPTAQMALEQLRQRAEAAKEGAEARKEGNVIRMEEARAKTRAAELAHERETQRLEADAAAEEGRLRADVLAEQTRQQTDLVKTESNAENAEMQRRHEAELEALRRRHESETEERRLVAEAERAARASADATAAKVAEAERAAMADASREAVSAANNESRERINAADNETALTIAREEIEHDNKVQVSTGTGIRKE